ncbi:hypothetical protein CF326_g8507, partial [Tilletia indica]
QPASHTLYLNDPHRLSILSLNITASTTISQASLPRSQDIIPNNNESLAVQGLSSSLHSPSAPASPLPGSSSTNHAGRTKDGIFDRAAAAFNRAAARAAGGGAVSSSERSRGADALKDVAQGLTAPMGSSSASSTTPAAGAAAGGLSPHQRAHSGQHSALPSPRTSSRPRSSTAGAGPIVEQRTMVTLKPQSFTFGRDSRLTSPFIPLDIAVRSQASGTDVDSGHVRETSSTVATTSSLAFISDPTPPLTSHTSAASGGSSADHGHDASTPAPPTFDPTRLLPLVSPPYPVARTRWKDVVESTSAHAATSLSSDAAAIVRRRAEAGEINVVLERNEIRLGFRLRLAASAPAVPASSSSSAGTASTAGILSPSSSLALTPSAAGTQAVASPGSNANANSSSTGAPSTAQSTKLGGLRSRLSADSLKSGSGPMASSPRSRTFGSAMNDSYTSAPAGGLGEVVFLCARSPRPLLEALLPPPSASGSSSILKSDEAAALEGVQRVVVNARTQEGQRGPRGAREEVFEWVWKPRSRATSVNGVVEGEKCCCAFVEIDPASGNATLLSYFAFFINAALPPVSPLPLLDAHYYNMPSSPDHWGNGELLPIPSGRPAVTRSSSSYLGRFPSSAGGHGNRTSSPPMFPQRSSSRPDTPSLLAALMANDGLSFVSSGTSMEGPNTSFGAAGAAAGAKRNSVQVLSAVSGRTTSSPPLPSATAIRRRSAFAESGLPSSADELGGRRGEIGLNLGGGSRLSPNTSPRLSARPDAFSSPRLRKLSVTSSNRGAEAVSTEPFPVGAEGGQEVDVQATPSGSGRQQRPSGAAPTNSEPPSAALLDLDRTELSLASISADTPIMRAAIHNLERRTALVKKASKSAVKAAGEVRAALTALQHAQGVLDEALEGSAAMGGGAGGLGSGGLLGAMPSTLGSLHAEYLRAARQRSAQMRKDEIDALFRHVEAPAQRTADLCRVAQDRLKVFESESKTYYSGTQKWLASGRSLGNHHAGHGVNGVSVNGTPGSEGGMQFASESGGGGVG